MRLILVPTFAALAIASVIVAAIPAGAVLGECYQPCVTEVGGVTLDLGSCGVPVYCWTIRATACLAEPGMVALAYWLVITDGGVGAALGASQPTGDPACPHRAVAEADTWTSAINPPEACLVAKAVAPSGAASAIECDS